jgi:hypothetical protein
MKRRDLLSRIAKRARELGVDWVLVTEGSEHTIYQVGSQKVSVPRHREINEYTAQGILKDTEGQLGKGWWR